MRKSLVLGVGIGGWLIASHAQQPSPDLTPHLQVLTNREVLLTTAAAGGPVLRLESSSDLRAWQGMALLSSNAASSYTDSAAPFVSERFYRNLPLEGTSPVLGDLLSTTNGEVTIHPINHATFLLTWNGKAIYADPVGGAGRFAGLPRADLILVTHAHSDHFDAPTISALKGSNCVLIAPPVVYQPLPKALKSITTVLTNGAQTNWFDLSLESVPAYNLSPTTPYHPKGVGNGYILTIGGRRIYVSGDTEDTPELRGLEKIDVAFVCMNLPYTMSVEKAASAVREFKPAVLYIYHYQGYTPNDVNRLKQLVGVDSGVEVRLRKWY